MSMNKYTILLAALFLGSAPLCRAAETPADTTQQAADKYNISFHESWTEQQRADMLHMYKLLSVDVPQEILGMAAMYDAIELDAVEAMSAQDIADALANKIEENRQRIEQGASMAEKIAARTATYPFRQLLKKTAAAGHGNISNKDGCTLAWIAIRLGKPEMVKELVRRGADPNAQLIMEDYILQPSPASEDLLCAIVGQSPMCESAGMTPEQYLELLQWMLENGADPNKSHPAMLSLCCQMEMAIHHSCTCTAIILDKLNSIPAECQEELARTMLEAVPESWSTFEHLFRKGLLTQEGIEYNESIFFALGMDAHADTPEKMEKLIALGFDPNYIPSQRKREEFASEEEYVDYMAEYCGDTPPLMHMIDDLAMLRELEEDPQTALQIRLQCLEVLLRHGATAELSESDLPRDEEARTKVAALLKQYNVPVLPDEVEEEDEEDEEEYDAEEDEEYSEDEEEYADEEESEDA